MGRAAFPEIKKEKIETKIKELPDENFGIGGKPIDEIKRKYKE